jgi:AcrR family transcriptional regulator
MTSKQLNIIHSALELFANEGYNAVSTKKIAIKADVSEGLIFRHFKNKRGLLDAIMTQAEDKLSELLTDILTEKNPHEALRKSIELPFSVKKKDNPYWQLQFKLKWEAEYNNHKKAKPWTNKLKKIFNDLNYDSPEMESIKLIQIIESTSIQLLRNELKNKSNFKKFLLKQYNL